MAILDEKIFNFTEDQLINIQLVLMSQHHGIKLSDSEINCLSLLLKNEECLISEFLKAASSDESELSYSAKIFKSTQTVRNFLTKAEKMQLIERSIENKKIISINPSLGIILPKGRTTLLNYKMVYRASNKN